jgi:membrane associated rhomboid family serine protease
MVAVSLGQGLAPPDLERWAIAHFAFIPGAYLIDGWPLWSLILAPLTYAFFHGGLLHILLNAVMLAVMGQVLERRLDKAWFFALFAIGAAGGAFAHALLAGATNVPLIGASAGVGGLYGAGLVLHRRGMPFGPQGRIITALAAFFIISNLLGLVLPILTNIAHVAHLGGFVAGALLAARIGLYPGGR